ncbi:Phosducin, thioredoxin-like domain, partial [Dillenia turbinata]
KKRLEEMKAAAKIVKYGSVIPISGSDFIREVSQAPSDVYVVVLLYKDGYAECGLMLQCLEELATRYPATKFVKIISTDCIPNYPDRNLPTLLVYNNGAVKANYVGLHSFGRRCTPEDAFPEDGVSSHNAIIMEFQNSLMLLKLTNLMPNFPGVALVLCRTDPVLNDGQTGNDPSRKAVIAGESRRLIEKVVAQHEDDDDGSSSD